MSKEKRITNVIKNIKKKMYTKFFLMKLTPFLLLLPINLSLNMQMSVATVKRDPANISIASSEDIDIM